MRSSHRWLPPCPAERHIGPGRYPARAGGPWLWSTLVLFLFHAVVVPSGLTTRVQPHRWITPGGGTAQQHAVLDRRLPAAGPCAGCGAPRSAGRLGAAAGPLAVPVPQQHRVADPRRDRLGVADVQRQARPGQAGAELPAAQEDGQPARAGQQVHGLADHRLLDGGPGRGGAGAGPRRPARSLSSSTQSRTRSSRASTLTSPVTMGAIAASHAIAAAASPSSQAPSFAPVSAACARRAAHRARTCSVHSSCRAESPSSRSRSAREMCAQALTGCPARSGSSPAGGQPAHASAVFLRHA